MLSDKSEVTQWIKLEQNIELQIAISHGNHNNNVTATPRPRRSGAFNNLFSSFRRRRHDSHNALSSVPK